MTVCEHMLLLVVVFVGTGVMAGLIHLAWDEWNWRRMK